MHPIQTYTTPHNTTNYRRWTNSEHETWNMIMIIEMHRQINICTQWIVIASGECTRINLMEMERMRICREFPTKCREFENFAANRIETRLTNRKSHAMIVQICTETSSLTFPSANAIDRRSCGLAWEKINFGCEIVCCRVACVTRGRHRSPIPCMTIVTTDPTDLLANQTTEKWTNNLFSIGEMNRLSHYKRMNK